ncbi:MAG TPA: PilT/PilU family type 4a pilus ATPase [Candidatus Brocadiia bacterium]|nr:PilT/PilU family type 4a pilus ATPase [Candidatus Brocadiia bacterium]
MPAQLLDELLRFMVEQKSSDLFLKVGVAPAIRIDGRVRFLKAEPITEEAMAEMLPRVLPEKARARYAEEGEVDIAYEADGVGRFRVNAYKRMGRDGFAFRHIPAKVPAFEELSLPGKQLRYLCEKPRGIVLITGVTGSGKSTTLAAMVDFMNQHQPRHIVTIEDPVEFVHKDNKCFVDQRELGFDTQNFVQALRAVVRQSPDVILIGEMRDAETVEAAIQAAQTGHLVLSTLHTVNAVQTLQRIVNFFPSHMHELIREELAGTLEGVLSQRLVRRSGGVGRSPVIEIMMKSPTVREQIERGDLTELHKAIKEGSHFGSQTFNQCLIDLVKAGIVDLDDAASASDKPEELRLAVRGLR